MYSKYRDKIIAIADEYTKTKNKTLLKKNMQEVFKKIG
jgi:hypothetical protein